MRAVTRALLRSELPIVYTEGFNPHPKLVFALPLSIYQESEYEIFDIAVEDGTKANFTLNYDNAGTLTGIALQIQNASGTYVDVETTYVVSDGGATGKMIYDVTVASGEFAGLYEITTSGTTSAVTIKILYTPAA